MPFDPVNPRPQNVPHVSPEASLPPPKCPRVQGFGVEGLGCFWGGASQILLVFPTRYYIGILDSSGTEHRKPENPKVCDG